MDDVSNTEPHVNALDRIVTTVERVGIPVATFAMGAWALFISTTVQLAVLPWLGAALILASLLTYVWLTARSTIKVTSPPPPVARELAETLAWMRDELGRQHEWARQRESARRQLGPGMGQASSTLPLENGTAGDE